MAAAVGGDPASATALAQQQFSAAIGRYAASVAQATANGQDASLVDTSEVQQAAQAIARAASAAGAYQALTQAKDGYAALSDGITQLDAQYGTLDSGIKAYSQAVSLVDAGAKNASTASAALASGTSQLNEGTDKLAQGLSAIAKGSASLDDGAQQLSDGTSSLEDGLQAARDGSEELTSQLQQGAQTIDESVASDPQTLGEYAINPIDVNDEVYGSLDKFGYGFAPLFLTLCMWLGALLVFFAFDPFPSRTHLKSNRFAAIFGRWPLYLCMSALEAAVVCIGSLACGLPCTNIAALVALFAVLAVSFMCIMQFFNLFDVPGKALAVLMVILQLVCCSGTFPAELGSDFATSVGPMLPFYYAIDAFREIVSGGVIQTALNDMGVLLCFGAAFTALSLLAYPFALKLKRKRAKQTVQAILGNAATPAAS